VLRSRSDLVIVDEAHTMSAYAGNQKRPQDAEVSLPTVSPGLRCRQLALRLCIAVRLDVGTKLIGPQAGPDEAAGQAGEERRFVEPNTHRPPGLATALGNEADGATTPTDGDESARSGLCATTRTRNECHASASRRLTLSCGATTNSFSTPWVPSAFPIPSGERRAHRCLGATVMNTSSWLVDLDRVHSS
jgi:hypothetical protein